MTQKTIFHNLTRSLSFSLSSSLYPIPLSESHSLFLSITLTLSNRNSERSFCFNDGQKEFNNLAY